MCAHKFSVVRGFLGLSLLIFMAHPGATQEPAPQKHPNYLVQNPESIRLELLPPPLELGETGDLLKKPYVEGEKFVFRLRMTNLSPSLASIPISDQYTQDRPILYKDGDVASYKKEIEDIIASRETDVSEHSRNSEAELKPNESKILQRFNLYDWYETLGPGHYQLSVKHRFQLGQPWIESSSITFEVVPKAKTVKP